MKTIADLEEYRRTCRLNNVDPAILAKELTGPPKAKRKDRTTERATMHDRMAQIVSDLKAKEEARLMGKHARMNKLVVDLQSKATGVGR